MGRAILDVDHANKASAARDRDGQEGFKAIFGEFVEKLEPGVLISIFRDYYGLAMLGDPARDALAELHLQTTHDFRVGILGRAQNEFFALEDVDHAGIAFHYRSDEFEDVL